MCAVICLVASVVGRGNIVLNDYRLSLSAVRWRDLAVFTLPLRCVFDTLHVYLVQGRSLLLKA